MHVFRLTALDELAPYADDWDRLAAGMPFRSWRWLSTWWRHYGRINAAETPRRRLAAMCVFDDADMLVGVAPWYLDVSSLTGSVLRSLGSGEVCSDYLGVLCQQGQEAQVAAALADYLTDAHHDADQDAPQWDLLELSAVDAEDLATGELLRHLAERGYAVDRCAGPNCWRIELPTQWDDYLAMLSKSHRKQFRRLQRNLFDTGRAVLHSVERLEELPAAIDILVELHRQRREALGQPGCFASRRFAAFHRDVMPRLLREGQLRLHWLELDGRPAAAEYHLAGGGIVYAYQSGMDPGRLDQEPGRLIILATVRRAIEQGDHAFDFLRGDEPYKLRFRARPRESFDVRVVPNRVTARLRDNLYRARGNVKQWIKNCKLITEHRPLSTTH